MAKRINLSSNRRGPAFEDRFSARTLRTPDQVARALERLHAERLEFRSDGHSRKSGPPLVASARTWLMRVGRMRAALFSLRGRPWRPRWWWPLDGRTGPTKKPPS